jgi:TPP-dependent pyruvate/acetoin dehydrogenase alpha subunit
MDIQSIEGGRARAELLSVLREDGSADPAVDPALSADRVSAIYESMLRTRVVLEQLAALSAGGRIGFVPPALGTEAAVVGATVALREQDWVFPTTGDFGAALARGVGLDALAHRVLGSAHDPLKGRDMPGALGARALRIASSSAPAATHLPHAVGFAWAARQRGEDLVTAAFFDAPEIDAADFHTGLNFAGVMKAPTVFVCRVREGEESAAERAVAYGIASARCDGSDLLAVVRTVGEAVDRAVEGHGATVIDLVIGEPGDALRRTRAYLERHGAWDEGRERAVRSQVEDELTLAIEVAAREGHPPTRTLFDDVYARPLPELERQRAELTSSRR